MRLPSPHYPLMYSDAGACILLQTLVGVSIIVRFEWCQEPLPVKATCVSSRKWFHLWSQGHLGLDSRKTSPSFIQNVVMYLFRNRQHPLPSQVGHLWEEESVTQALLTQSSQKLMLFSWWLTRRLLPAPFTASVHFWSFHNSNSWN